MPNTLVGLFNSSDAARKAVQDLLAAGVERRLISDSAPALAGMGVPAREAALYAEGVRKGGALVVVRPPDAQVTTVQGIMDRDGAIDIDAAGDKVEIVEEQLQVGKREVERGGLRVRSFVTEQAVSEQVTLREEHVDVTRTKVDRPATGDAFQDVTIEMRETAEVPVVAKEARVVEEITLGKTATERTETITDTVRRQNVEVLRIDAPAGATALVGGDLHESYRSHLATTAPGANDARHAPAYEYGEQLSRDPVYGNSEWSTNEDAIRAKWEAHNPGTWDEFKASVKHAFESAKAKVGSH